jgi:hypothetical protein
MTALGTAAIVPSTPLHDQSFDAIWPARRNFADLFYRRFFALAPDAQHLFPSDMERQRLKLMDTIAAIVGALDERELFQSIIRRLEYLGDVRDLAGGTDAQHRAATDVHEITEATEGLNY